MRASDDIYASNLRRRTKIRVQQRDRTPRAFRPTRSRQKCAGLDPNKFRTCAPRLAACPAIFRVGSRAKFAPSSPRRPRAPWIHTTPPVCSKQTRSALSNTTYYDTHNTLHSQARVLPRVFHPRRARARTLPPSAASRRRGVPPGTTLAAMRRVTQACASCDVCACARVSTNTGAFNPAARRRRSARGLPPRPWSRGAGSCEHGRDTQQRPISAEPRAANDVIRYPAPYPKDTRHPQESFLYDRVETVAVMQFITSLHHSSTRPYRSS